LTSNKATLYCDYMTRMQNAERVVRETFVSVRRARREGFSDLVTRDAMWEIASELPIGDFSMRTAVRLARREAELMDEMHLLDLGKK
jgi:hypothetical protein